MNQITGASDNERGTAAVGDLRLKVLLAEDDEICQYLCRHMLDKCGFSVHAVGDGKQAVEAARDGDFDLMLTDLFMPVMDGLDAAAMIRRNEEGADRRLPIIAVSSYELGEHEKSPDVDAYVGKPFDLQELLCAINSLVER